MLLSHLLQSSRLPANEARILAAHVLNEAPSWLLAHGDEPVEATAAARFNALAQRRRQGEPVAYLVGYKEFWGLRFKVTNDVLIPRPDTETLVEAALAFLSDYKEANIVDLGCGSGAIGLTLAHERREARVTLVDNSEAALELAHSNALSLFAAAELAEITGALTASTCRINFVLSSWFSGLAAASPRFDLIVSNPPYIPENDPHVGQGDLRFEPKCALTAGKDGLDELLIISQQAPRYLKPGGKLMVEHGYDQSEAVAALFHQNGFRVVKQHRDLAGIIRVTEGRAASA